MSETPEKLRIDKWLWHARFFKSRALAAGAVEKGVRVDGLRVTKPARTVSPGVVLTFSQGERVRVIKVIAIGTRRGPAKEAQELYEDLSPPEPKVSKPGHTEAPTPKFDGGGRPSKKDRRKMRKSPLHPLE